MRGRTGMKKAVARGAAIAVAAVVGLLLLSNSGMPLIPGRPPMTSDPDPVGVPPEGPIADAGAISVQVSLLDLSAHDLSAPVGPQDSATAGDLRGPVQIPARDLQAYLDTEIDRDDGEVRSERDRSSWDTNGALASVLLALIMLKTVRDQDRDRRSRSSALASAA